MRVEVKIVIAPHPPERVQEALRAVGKRLASATDTVSVQIRASEPPTALLKFEMLTVTQYKVVDKIFETVKFYAWEFYEDITVRFPRGN
ncbi:MAG: hypothetical protein V3S14_14190 [Anaerolineae bacterium]